MMLVLLLGTLGVATTEAGFDETGPLCENDVQGKDDEPGQKDLTRFCRGTSDATLCTNFDFPIKWNWDITALSGKNTGDACALFDTDGDGFANYALCVTIGNSPAAQLANSPRLYQCDDTRVDRCQIVSQITNFSSTCSVAQTASDPFNAGGLDTTATCCIDLGDLGNAAGARLMDVCSYPSQQPNSDPSDCVVTEECNNDDDCTDDGNECTNEICSNGVCTHPVNTGGSCDDGNACTLNDTCASDGTCGGGLQKDCPATDQCHLAGTCDPSTGDCSNPPVENGTSCSDSNACTGPDTCQSGVCTPGTAVVCTALDQCHDVGVCDTTTGVCSNPDKPNNTPCTDGNACTTGEACQAGVCTGGTETVCTAQDQCHNAGICDTTTGACSNPAKPDNTPCSDGNQCTGPDVCQSGICVSGGPVVIPD
jgi:hypothetical protein